MKIVAIDPGTKNVGIAHYDNEIFFDTLLKKESGKMGVINLVKKTIGYIKTVNPEYIVLEDYAHSSNFNKEEAEFMGMLYFALYSHSINCDICLVPITSVKAYMSSGKATKSEVMKSISLKTGIAKKDMTSHSADAISILRYFLDYLSGKLVEKQSKMLYNRTFNIFKNYFTEGK
jgi:Holliday junction resolvasome RuvABC endonuclease subunit